MDKKPKPIKLCPEKSYWKRYSLRVLYIYATKLILKICRMGHLKKSGSDSFFLGGLAKLKTAAK